MTAGVPIMGVCVEILALSPSLPWSSLLQPTGSIKTRQACPLALASWSITKKDPVETP